MTWKLSAEMGFGLADSEHPVQLTRWAGHLDYRRGEQDHRQPLPFTPTTFSSGGGPTTLFTDGKDVGIRLHLDLGRQAGLRGVVQNTSTQDLFLETLALISGCVQLGASPARFAFFKNGYQSWTETRAFSPDEGEKLPFPSIFSVLQANPRNLASGQQGEFNADMFCMLANLDGGVFLLAGQDGGFRQFVYLRGKLPQDDGSWPRLELVYDFGGQMIPPGAQVELDGIVILAGDHSNRLQDCYFDRIAVEEARSRELPNGWCSWYYYFGSIDEAGLLENLEVARTQGVDWRYFLLDDGYSTAVGDWLSLNEKFPRGLKPIADECREQGMTPGLWLAPFVARHNSALVRDHPEWTLKNNRGKPVKAGWNPNWGLGGIFYALDTTHPGFQAYLRRVISTVVQEWGFELLKVDFVYGASLYGVAHDRSLTPAERLRLGYRLIREAAGENLFLLGCGSPLGPALGMVDAMRIGPDVAPYWYDPIRSRLLRDPHALCTRSAIRSILNRCQMHRKLWINDPDCLLLRETNTKLSPDERRSLVNAVVISGGMYLLSDRLAEFSPEIWSWLDEIDRLVRACDQGRAWVLDTMEREMPEVVYNSAGYLAVFNFQDRAVHKKVSIDAYLVGVAEELVRGVDVWSGDSFPASEGTLDLGEVRPHASLLLRLES